MSITKRVTLSVLLAAVFASVAAAQGGIRWQGDLAQACGIAQRDQRLVLLHFYTENCGPCQMLEHNVFPNPAVSRAVAENYVPVKLDAARERQLAQHYGVRQFPTDVILDSEGRVIYHTVSPQDPTQYTRLLRGVANDHLPAPRVASNLPSERANPYGPNGRQETTQPNRTWTPSPPAEVNSRPDGGFYSNSYRPPQLSPTPGHQAGGEARTMPYESRYARQYSPQTPAPHARPYTAAAQPPNGLANSRPSAEPNGGTPPAAGTEPAPQALDGFCPVSLADQEMWVKGDPKWGAVHRGRTYLFASAEHQRRFLANPDHYSPVLSGYDPVLFIEQGTLQPGHRSHGMWFRGKTYLFADEASLQRFTESADYFAQKTHEIMMAGGR
jgi:protein disulfide-isomerase